MSCKLEGICEFVVDALDCVGVEELLAIDVCGVAGGVTRCVVTVGGGELRISV